MFGIFKKKNTVKKLTEDEKQEALKKLRKQNEARKKEEKSASTEGKKIITELERLEIYDGEFEVLDGLIHSDDGFAYEYEDGTLRINPDNNRQSACSQIIGNNSIVSSSFSNGSCSIINGIKYSTRGKDIYISGNIEGNVFLNGKLLTISDNAEPLEETKLVKSVKIGSFHIESIIMHGESSLKINQTLQNNPFQDSIDIYLSGQSSLSFGNCQLEKINADLSGQSSLYMNLIRANKIVVDTSGQSRAEMTKCTAQKGSFDSSGQSSIVSLSSSFKKVSKDSSGQSRISV